MLSHVYTHAQVEATSSATDAVLLDHTMVERLNGSVLDNGGEEVRQYRQYCIAVPLSRVCRFQLDGPGGTTPVRLSPVMM